MAHETGGGPLADIRVVDLAGEAGLFAGRLLAELGADVVRVEPPGGDSSRRRGPFLRDLPGPERSLYHMHFNAGKRGVVLDLDRAEDRAAFRRLAATADVLIETAAPGHMDAMGLGYEALGRERPDLIYLTITPFGQDGPFRGYRGNDLIGAATSGLMYLNGFAEDPPNVPGSEQAYHMASLAAASGALVALAGRERDPARRGRRVDVSVQEAASMATVQTANANMYTWHGQVVRRRALGDAMTVFPCRDGLWVSFVVPIGAPALWGGFVDWLRAEGLVGEADEPAWRDESHRWNDPPAVVAMITALAARHDRADLFAEGQRRRLLVMPVNSAADLVADPQFAARGFFVSRELPGGGAAIDTGTPFRLGTEPGRVARRAPQLGEHTAELLDELERRPTGGPGRDRQGRGGRPALPLEGVRVLDFFWQIAGPAATRVLADFGAEVIKVESAARVDNIRRVGVWPREADNLDENAVFNDCNTNKRAITLNLGTARGIDLVKDLVARCDIVTNNFTGDRMDRWGLGYDELRRVRPDIIMLTMPVMGTTGPRRTYGSYGNGVIAFGGLNLNTGFADRPPVGIAPLYSDFSTPYFAVSALMAALYRRERTGTGSFIDLAQAEATASLLGTGVLEFTANGRVAGRPGNRSADHCPHGAFRCAGDDRWCAISVGDAPAFEALCAAIGRPELATDPRFATHAGRKAHEEELEALVSAWTREHDPWDVMHTLQAVGVMAGVVEDLQDMVERDPGLSTRHLVPVSRPGEDFVFTTHAQPARMSGELPPLRRAPRYGEANEYVFRGLLGLGDDEYTQLLVDGVLY